jgi:hypothetical protein
MAHIFGLPSVPGWADWFYKKLDENLAIHRIYGLGFDPVLVTGTKEELLRWLSEGIAESQTLINRHFTHWPGLGSPVGTAGTTGTPT